MVGTCNHGDKSSGSIRGRTSLARLIMINCSLKKKYCAPNFYCIITRLETFIPFQSTGSFSSILYGVTYFYTETWCPFIVNKSLWMIQVLSWWI